MKTLSIVVSIFALSITVVSAKAQANTEGLTKIYSCECIDTGMECDGGENMSLVLRANGASITLADDEGKFPRKIDAQLDPTFSPTVNVKYSRFTVKNPPRGSNYATPYVLITKNMLKGASKGSVKIPEISTSGGAYEWFYSCKILGSQG